ncbi:MAG: helix-turn-helix domain-containing protein [Pseudorhodobacter sp.]|nr:helix-turn-helix domain-containing protein [Pseudorhodobacter sp.]
MTAPIPAADLRSTMIIDSIRKVFAEKGFDGASMQDLARAAEMSVGNFYRYFPSKAAIVAALVTQDLATMEQDFAAIINAPQPMQSLRTTLESRIHGHICADDGPIWAEITAAALRKAEIGTIVSHMEAEVIGYLIAVFARDTGLDPATVRLRFQTHAELVVLLVKASAMQKSDAGAPRDALIALTLRMIDRILDEVSDATPNPSESPL